MRNFQYIQKFPETLEWLQKMRNTYVAYLALRQTLNISNDTHAFNVIE